MASGPRNELPEKKGFSGRNIMRKLAFYRLYFDAPIDAPQVVPEIIVPMANSPFTLLPAILWGNNTPLMEEVKADAAGLITIDKKYHDHH